MTATQTAALDYAERGWAILPTRGKVPDASLAPHGLRSASSDPDTVRRWFRLEPDDNVAIACRESGLLALDVDDRHGGDDMFFDLEHRLGSLPETPRSLTGGGFHVLLHNPQERTRARLGPGIDVRDNAYVVAPPSAHASGRRYEWEIGPDEAPVAELPASWREAVCAPAESTRARTGGGWWLDPDAVAHVLPRLGITAPVGRNFRCVLPGHDDRGGRGASVSATTLMYRCWHGQDPGTYQLSEVYASQQAGHVVRLDGVALARWGDRLAHESGLLGMVSTIDSTVYGAHDLTEAERRVADGFLLLFGLNLAQHPDSRGVMFSAEFAAAWCGVSRATAVRAIGRLRSLDLIRRTGQARAGRRANLYVPGDGTRPPVNWQEDKFAA
jgi:Bifunctional DNA primase/polymerase, N-terminal